MPPRDYYNVLSVTRDASQDEIKKAYRSLAMRYHPDRNPGDEEAIQRFKDIADAYATLGDAEKRARYDRLGPLYTPDGRPPRPEDLNEWAGTVMSNIFRRRRRDEEGEDLRFTLSLSLEEVAAGVEKTITVPRMVRCKTCAGEGAEATGKETCEICGGTGKSTGPRIFRTQCYHCDGQGFVTTKNCATCSGEGRIQIDDPILVKVPAGVATGQKLKLSQKGNEPRISGKHGDLYVIVSVSDHPLFRRRGEDLVAELPLTFPELALGADITVPTLEGTTTIRVPAGTPPGRIFRLAGRGLPRVGGSRRGDLHLHVEVEVPEVLTDEQRQALEAWRQSLPAEAHPRRAAFDKEVQNR